MGFLDRIRLKGSKSEAFGFSAIIPDTSSSPVSSASGIVNYGEYPLPSFRERLEAYDTIGKIFAAVEGYVKGINKRDFYWASTDEKNPDENAIKLMKEWERKFHASKLIDTLVHDLLIFGTAIVATTDWLPVQMTSVKYMKRKGRTPTEIMLQVNGNEILLGSVWDEREQKYVQKIPIDNYLVLKYIDINQEAWGRGLYHAILTTFTDIDNRQSKPVYQWVRQLQQDGGKIYHKMATPFRVYGFPGVTNKDEYDVTKPGSLANKIKNREPGASIMVQSEVTTATDAIDGKSRFQEIKQDIFDEVEVTTQSSASRMITRPSAMADARVADDKDDDTMLNIMEVIRRFMDEEVIPRVVKGNVGMDERAVEFKWGKEDDFEFEFEEVEKIASMQIDGRPVASIEEVRDMLKKTGTPLDDEKYQTFLGELEARRKENQPQMQQQMQQQPPANNEKPDEDDKELKQLKKEAYRKIARSTSKKKA